MFVVLVYLFQELTCCYGKSKAGREVCFEIYAVHARTNSNNSTRWCLKGFSTVFFGFDHYFFYKMIFLELEISHK